MIVRLMPEQISGFWSLIKTGVIDIGGRISPGNWDYSNNVFNRCLAGLLQVWLCAEEVDSKPEFKGFFITAIDIDPISEERTLSIQTIYVMKNPSKELYQEAKQRIEDYAKANSCKVVTIMTDVGHREKLVEEVWPDVKKKTLFIIPVRK